MKEPNYRKSTERLLLLWVLSLFVGGNCWRILCFVLQLDTGLLSLNHLITTLLVVFYSLPLLFKIVKTAKLAKMNAIKIFAICMIVHHCFWLLMNVIGTICALIWPGRLN